MEAAAKQYEEEKAMVAQARTLVGKIQELAQVEAQDKRVIEELKVQLKRSKAEQQARSTTPMVDVPPPTPHK